jgi:hypothetical protein
MTMRLYLVGPDEALDVIAELSRHLDYFSVSRLDDPPEDDDKLGADDHLVLGLGDRARAAQMLARMMSAGHAPKHVVLVEDPVAGNAGVRAILAAAELVGATRVRDRTPAG